MKALIDPRFNRVVQLRETEFEVAAPLKWVDVADGVTPETHNYVNDAVVAKPAPLGAPKALRLDALADLLVSKNLLTQAEVDGAKK